MSKTATNVVYDNLSRNEAPLLDEWLRRQTDSASNRRDLIDGKQLREQSQSLLAAVREAFKDGSVHDDVMAESFAQARELLAPMARLRARQGFSPTETAWFVLSLKQPLFDQIARSANDPRTHAEAVVAVTNFLDRLAIYTMETHQLGREEVIQSQQREMLELSTPVVQLWEGILALPLIGTLDSNRTQVVMESLLRSIVQTGSSIAILDITGVPMVDTLVAQHLLKTVAAARLMGAECIISGIRPQIAQTIVHLGVDLGGVMTKANLADAFALALTRRSLQVVRSENGTKRS